MTIQSYWCIEWHAEIGSTMERATELAQAGAPSGTVVVADFQHQGRGTRGRVWHAPPETCLMFTLLVRPRYPLDRLSELPFQVASSVSGVLRDQLRLPATVKIPNDVLIDGRKVCGILCTSRVTGDRLDWVSCGMGLNTTMAAEQLPFPESTSLKVAGITDVPPHGDLLEMVLGRLAWLRDR